MGQRAGTRQGRGGYLLRRHLWEFLGGPVVRAQGFHCWDWVQSLVRELRLPLLPPLQKRRYLSLLSFSCRKTVCLLRSCLRISRFPNFCKVRNEWVHGLSFRPTYPVHSQEPCTPSLKTRTERGNCCQNHFWGSLPLCRVDSSEAIDWTLKAESNCCAQSLAHHSPNG